MSEIKSPITLTTGADVAAKRLVKLSSSTVIHNTVVSTDVPIGITDYAADSGDNVAVRLLSEAGTIELTAAGVIAADAVVYAAAAGKVSAISTAGGIYKKIGIAIEAATADGDIIEILPYQFGETTEVATDLTVAAPVVVPGSINTIDSTDNAVDATLADDTEIGRQTKFVMSEASNSSTVTIAHHDEGDAKVYTFDTVDDAVVIEWTGTEYVTIFAAPSTDFTTLTTGSPAIVPGSTNLLNSVGGAITATLADDTVVGRHTLMIMTEASTSSTVTIAKHTTSDPEVATFDAAGEVLDLMWMGTEYVTIYATATFV